MQKGITLIETVLYIALLSVLMLGLVPWMLGLETWRRSLEANNWTVRKNMFAEGVVGHMVRSGEAISSHDFGENSDVFFEINTDHDVHVLEFGLSSPGKFLGTTSYPISQ